MSSLRIFYRNRDRWSNVYVVEGEPWGRSPSARLWACLQLVGSSGNVCGNSDVSVEGHGLRLQRIEFPISVVCFH